MKKRFLAGLFRRGNGEGEQGSSFDAPKEQEVGATSVTADTEKMLAPEKQYSSLQDLPDVHKTAILTALNKAVEREYDQMKHMYHGFDAYKKGTKKEKDHPVTGGTRDNFTGWVGRYFLDHREEIGVAANDQVFQDINDVFDARIATYFADQTA